MLVLFELISRQKLLNHGFLLKWGVVEFERNTKFIAKNVANFLNADILELKHKQG